MSVDILIGSDYYWNIIENKVVRGESGPVAIKSKVGYILSASFYISAISNSTAFVCYKIKCSYKIVTHTLHKTVEKFWGIEKIGIEENRSVYNPLCEEISFDENNLH